jgi:hypothetical protein
VSLSKAPEAARAPAAAPAADPTAVDPAEPIWAMGTNGLPATTSDTPAPLWPTQPAAPPRRRMSMRDVRSQAVWALAVAAIMAVLGAPLGWLWATVSPRVVLEMTSAGPSFTEPNPEGYVAGESLYVLICLGVGLISAIAVWLLVRRRRGPIVLVGLAAGSIAGALLMAWLGHKVGLAEYERLLNNASVGTRFEMPVKVRSTVVYHPVVLGVTVGVPLVRGAALVQAMIAVATYTALAGFSTTATLHRPERREPAPDQFSWDSPEWQDRQAAPAPPGVG